MRDDEENPHPKDPARDERPWRRVAVISCLMFGLPMLLLAEPLSHAFYAWLGVAGVYLGLLLLFGTGFVLEGGLFGFILALLLAVVLRTWHQAQALSGP